MTESVSKIVVGAGEKCAKVVRISMPPDRAQEHCLDICVEPGGVLELQELYQTGAGKGVVRVESGEALELEEHYEGNPGAAGLRMRVRVELAAGAKMRHAAVVDGGGSGAFSFDRRIELEQGAELEYTRVGAAGAARPGLERVRPGAGAAGDDECLVVSMNGARCRFRHAALMIMEADCKSSLDLCMTHQAADAVSESLCRCILGAGSSGRFTGRIVIAPEGQGADARMRNDNLLLDDTAHMETSPELEVYADEVQCAHGAATGALDESALFYLKTRGLSPQQARAMLVQAFASRISDAITLADAQTLAATILSRALDDASTHKLAA